MSISVTGDGLNILIACDYVPHHDWMSFLCWYSLSKNLPDAKVFVASHRRIMNHNLFDWTRKCDVPLTLHKSTDAQGQIALAKVPEPLLVVSAESICVRDFGESGFSPDSLSEGTHLLDDSLCCDCKDIKPCTFVTYSGGWGKFVTSSWIDKTSCPFVFGVKYAQGEMTVNEVRIGRLWGMATPLFQTLSRG